MAAADRAEALVALGIREVTHHCPQCGSEQHGRPWAEGVGALSLSHAGGLTLAAISDGAVGIDHEPVGVTIERSVVAHPSETADSLRLWVRKEAILKATGLGLSVDPTSFWIDEDGRPSTIAGSDEAARLKVIDLELDGFIAAVAASPTSARR